jgi:hypothetical protein
MRLKRVAWLVLLPLLVVFGGIAVTALLLSGVLWPVGWQPRRTVREVERGTDIRNASVAGLDLRERGDMIRTFGFNLRTLWRPPDRLPAGLILLILIDGMNAGGRATKLLRPPANEQLT